jgi:hypothetical protein
MAVKADQNWHSPLLCIWSAVEPIVAILRSCAPTLKCLILRFWPEFLNLVISNYGSARCSDNENPAGTTRHSNSNMLKASFQKPGKISDIEAGAGANQPSSRLQAFRCSLSKPFSSDKSRRHVSCDNDHDDTHAIDLNTYPSSAPSVRMPSQLGRDVEVDVEVVVEQISDANPGGYSKPPEWRPC